MRMKRLAILAMVCAGLPSVSSTAPRAGEFVGLDPYNRPVYAREVGYPTVPLSVSPPVFRRNPGAIGGPLVSGPLYYAEPAPPAPGIYRDDPALAAGAVLAYDLDAALAQADRSASSVVVRRNARPAAFTGEWYRYCEARYRSFDRDSGTFQPSSGPRRLCR